MKKEKMITITYVVSGIFLLTISFLGGMLVEKNLSQDTNVNDKVTYEIETIEDSKINNPVLYIEGESENIYLIGLSNIYSNQKDLSEVYNCNYISNLIEKINYSENNQDYIIYRDFKTLSNNGLSLVKCNNSNNIYIGPMNLVFNSDFCISENPKNGTTFIKTYKVLNVADSNDYDYLYLTLRQYQCEEVVTVRVKRKLCPDIKANSNYEFTFEYTSNMVEENINSVFSNTNLLKITLTDKEGMDQIQDGV